jgi:hypothetical protein
MIAEDLLERGLGAAAEEYDVPDTGIDRLRELLAPAVDDAPATTPAWRTWRPSRNAWMATAAAAAVGLVAVSIAIGGNGTSSDSIDAAGGSSASHGPAVARLGADEPGSTATSKGGRPDLGGVPVAVPTPAPALPGRKSELLSSSRSAAGGTSGVTTYSSKSLVGSPIPPAPGDAARIVKTGELDLQVPKGEVTRTLDRLTALAAFERGYISDSSSSEGDVAPGGQVTMRVPVNAFEPTVTRARGYGKVLSLETSGVDVTGKYVDLQARIRALDATRHTFLTLLAKAQTIGETLAVQDRVTQVQTQIEQLQGQVKVLRNQSAMSTLTITVDQKAAVVVAHRPHQDNGFVKAVKLSVSRFVRGIEAIIGVIGPILLVLLLIGLGWVAAKVGYRSLRRRMV